MGSEHEKLPRRRPIRLARSVYEITGQPVLITTCTSGRQPVLPSGSMPGIIDAGLRAASEGVPVELFVWCLMPDHFHALVAPDKEGNVVDWVRRFKGRVAADARQQGLRNLWQRSFHDHVVRVEEAVSDVVSYILANPVRAGLVEDWRKWPHHGSLTWD
jgi:REP element-mobilizing transposase RayT